MGVIILAVIGLATLEYFIAKKTAFGFLIPLISLGYLLYELIVRYKEPNFVFMDILFQILLFVTVTAVWICMALKKKSQN